MTAEEAQRIAGIAIQADGGCSVCGMAQLDSLKMAFPDFDWIALARVADPECYWLEDTRRAK